VQHTNPSRLMLHAAAGRWKSPTDDKVFSQKVKSFEAAGRELATWLERVSADAGGAPMLMLAHNGASYDWPVLTRQLAAVNQELPPCVTLLGCSRSLFVAGHQEVLGKFWSMQYVYAAHFNGAAIPNAHSAEGDIWYAHAVFFVANHARS
jgi:hypothetical protein